MTLKAVRIKWKNDRGITTATLLCIIRKLYTDEWTRNGIGSENGEESLTITQGKIVHLCLQGNVTTTSFWRWNKSESADTLGANNSYSCISFWRVTAHSIRCIKYISIRPKHFITKAESNRMMKRQEVRVKWDLAEPAMIFKTKKSFHSIHRWTYCFVAMYPEYCKNSIIS